MPEHGRYTRYNVGCRCEPCREAHNQRVRAYLVGPGKPANQERRRLYRQRNPERTAAYRAVNRAVASGRLTKPDRCGCGRNARVAAHHDDYARPLDVIWLCGACHKARHAMLRRQEAAA